jgi:anti-sigma regulatory factor (Ser/Thr protein kinase)
VEYGIARSLAVHGDHDHEADAGFCHEAFLYGSQEQFLHGTATFIRDGLDNDEPALVVVDARKVRLLRGELGQDAEHVQFADMAEVGSNPARIMQAWRDFVAERAPDRPARGIGEPIGPDRTRAQLAECQRHESLLNLAFADTPAFWLMCPYDTKALDPDVVDEALRSHPVVSCDGIREGSPLYGGIEAATAPFRKPLPPPQQRPKEFYFEAATLAALRQYVQLRAADAGLSARRTEDLLLAVNEVATNSLRHADGCGTIRVWEEPHAVICEVRDGGTFDEPLAGRERPIPDQIGGFGLWLSNQVCDLVQIRSIGDGTVVRLHMHRD